MYRNYQEYLTFFEDVLAKNVPPGVFLKKQTLEQFLWENYRDKIEWYLMEEWDTNSFTEIFYGNCYLSDVEESDELTPEEIRAEELHGGVHDIIEDGFEKGLSIPQTAKKVFDYLSKEKAIQQSQVCYNK